MTDLGTCPRWLCSAKMPPGASVCKARTNMPADQTRVGPNTPMGANLVPGGCTFRAWAPRADAVYVGGSFNGWKQDDDASRLVRDANGSWSGFLPGVTAGAEYKFFV